MHPIVYGYGPSPCVCMLVGEAPGETESIQGRPFVGRSGQEQARCLARHGMYPHQFYMTNIVKQYQAGNPDPTPDQIAYWSDYLLDEIATVQPRLVVAVGRFAMRWFLGESAELQDAHGMPHVAGQFDSSIASRLASCLSSDAIILPIYHPAWALRSEQPDAKTILDQDYAQVAYYYKLIKGNRQHLITLRRDEHEGNEQYLDVTGQELSDYLTLDCPDEIGLDTEGTPGQPWSIQISTAPGTAYILRYSQPDFSIGIRALQQLVDSGCLIITHDAGTPAGCCYDTIMCREMGLELADANLFNTMEASFLLRTESRALKTLMDRFLCMKQDDYMSLIGGVAKQRQIDYLYEVAARDWPKPETRQIRENDGTIKPYTPQAVSVFSTSILRDIDSGKLNNKGEPTDPYARWMGTGQNKGVDKTLRKQVESSLGPMPVASLDDIPLHKAVYYAGRDSHGTLCLKAPLLARLHHLQLTSLFRTRTACYPMFEEIQRSGMPASRRRFEKLSEYVTQEMIVRQQKISSLYYDGQPFNPGSSKQTADLMQRLGLQGEKTTKYGSVSTAKKSIEHLRDRHPAMELVMSWREHAKVKSTYVEPILRIADKLDPDKRSDSFVVHTIVKPVTVETRRLSSEKPPLLNVPVRTEIGRKVRACYVTPEGSGEVFVAVDYSGQEMRVAAHVSQDRLLCLLFTQCRHCMCSLPSRSKCTKSENGQHEARDPHSEAAIRVFGIQPTDVDKDTWKNQYRLPAKTSNFGILYGLSGAGLLDSFRQYNVKKKCIACSGVGKLRNGDVCLSCGGDGKVFWKLDECERLIKEILRSVYPDMSACIRRIQQETIRTGMVRDLYGMIRYLPAAWSHDRKESAEAGRQAFSHVIQGTAQGMMQSAMAWLRPRIRDLQKASINVRTCLQIHDELIFITDEDIADEIMQLTIDAFVNHSGIKLRVPIEAEGHVGRSWADLK